MYIFNIVLSQILNHKIETNKKKDGEYYRYTYCSIEKPLTFEYWVRVSR